MVLEEGKYFSLSGIRTLDLSKSLYWLRYTGSSALLTCWIGTVLVHGNYRRGSGNSISGNGNNNGSSSIWIFTYEILRLSCCPYSVSICVSKYLRISAEYVSSVVCALAGIIVSMSTKKKIRQMAAVVSRCLLICEYEKPLQPSNLCISFELLRLNNPLPPQYTHLSSSSVV